jgi:hypothetical protein
MKRIVPSFLALLLTSGLHAAEPKKVVVSTVTTGFRHSSIPTAEKTLQRLADSSKEFTIVEFVRQPEVQIREKPGKPGDLKPDADEKAKAKYERDMTKYNEEMARWTPEMEARAKSAQADFDAQLKANLAKLSPQNLTREQDRLRDLRQHYRRSAPAG